jgi:ReqiPepy6 Gp37-like protein
MEVYILDSLYRRIEVVDRFESIIWTERWDDIGDVQLQLPSSSSAKSLFTPGTDLAVNTSTRVMTVETAEDTVDDDGKKIFKVTGRSLEKNTEDRILVSTYAGFSLLNYYVINALTPSDVMNSMFDSAFYIGAVHPNDAVPLYVPGQTLYPADTIPAPSALVTQQLDADTVYGGLRSYSQIYDLGWRFYRNHDAGQLFFNVYPGSNRTVRQSTLPAVVFSPEMQNLHNTNELSTVKGTKNIAYVFADVSNSSGGEYDGFQYVNVYAPGVDMNITGFQRQAMLVKMGSLDATTIADVPGEMTRAGLDALAKARSFRAFDGEVLQTTGYQYEVDYYLGDLVTMQNADGYMNDMRVTEQIMTQDESGERSYPTLSLRQFYTPGTWENAGSREWAQAGSTEYWSTSP